MADSDNNPSTPGSPTSAGFSTDRLPNRTTDSYSDEDEAAVDHNVVVDDVAEVADEEVEGADLFNDNFMDDYQVMRADDRYEVEGLDDSMEDERELGACERVKIACFLWGRCSIMKGFTGWVAGKG